MPRTSWILFAQDKRDEIKKLLEKDGAVSFGDVCRHLAQEWKSLPAEEKTPYVEKYQQDRERYKQDLSQLTKDDLAMLRKHRRARKLKHRSMPTSPRSAYMIFTMDMRPTVVEQNPQISFQDVGRELGRLWHVMSVESKQVYQQRALDDKARHVREKEAWLEEEKAKKVQELEEKKRSKHLKQNNSDVRSPQNESSNV
jgi:hypothetical protein